MNTMTTLTLKAPPTIRGFAAAHPLMVSRDGTEISDTQKSILRSQIESFDALTDARDAAAHLATIIEAEERDTVILKPTDIHVGDDCAVRIAEEDYGISDVGFTMLARAIGPSGAASYLRAVPVELRAHNIKALLAHRTEPLKLRTRNGADPGSREIYSIVSDSYPSVYASDILRRVATRAATDAKALWTYDPNTTRVSFKELMRQEINPDTYTHSSDDVFQVGREWSLRDDGSTSVRMALLTFRQLCANMLMLATDSFMKRVRHRGDVTSMLTRVDGLFDQTSEFTRIFSESWNAARHTRWATDEEPRLDTAIDAYGYLLAHKHLPASKDKDLLAADLGVAWMAEPGNTVADLVNGVTRYARTQPATNTQKFRAQELETAAGTLLSVPTKTWEATRRL